MNQRSAFDGPRPVKLTVDDFALLHAAGALAGYHHAELIEGTVTDMSPQQRPHSFAKNELTHRLRMALEAMGSRFTAQSEVTLALPPHNAPEPDIVVTDAPRGEGYMPASSVALVVEVADSSIRYDLGDKQRLYAAGGIAEYWVVDVTEGVVHQFWNAADGEFARSHTLPLAGRLTSVTLPELAIDGAGIL
ncbi:Uma2 family endonuclease [Sphingomonas sp. A2-49]|uniref:Uma2 family endonuclease n=1 Tax=Sphingomonas sp. A2-49 TaxID=1391375 RepID=UPI0021D1BDEC|nr:Uma2 family endonuclease [Sphingomonas sp. A2-49]MCU6454890.1 Uma2 family endonuclease [Sphingomonas sp. A2-49]